MDVHPAEIVIAIEVIQAIGSLVLAYLLLYFYRIQPRRFLRHWAFCLISLALYMVTSAVSLWLFVAGDAYPFVRLGLSIVALISAYLHVAWFLMGTYEAAYERLVSDRLQRYGLILAGLFGIVTASITPFDPEQNLLRTLLRFDLRYGLTGIAFLAAAWILWRVQRVQKLIGIRIGAIGFGLYGLHLFHVVAVSRWHSYSGNSVFLSALYRAV